VILSAVPADFENNNSNYSLAKIPSTDCGNQGRKYSAEIMNLKNHFVRTWNSKYNFLRFVDNHIFIMVHFVDLQRSSFFNLDGDSRV